MVKVVIFDLDDTLISEKDYIISGFMHISEIIGKKYQKKSSEVLHKIMELFQADASHVFNRLLEIYNPAYEKEEVHYLVGEYRKHYPDVRFFEDVNPCLEFLKNRRIKTGIITDGYLEAQSQKVKAVKGNQLFDKVILTEELGREFWKPHPKAFEMMKEHFHVEFDEMVYVGDNPQKDFYIGSIYPITTVRIHRNGVYEKASYYENVKEKYTIHDLSELYKTLDLF